METFRKGGRVLNPILALLLSNAATDLPAQDMPFVDPRGLDKYRIVQEEALTPQDEERIKRAREKRARKAAKRLK